MAIYKQHQIGQDAERNACRFLENKGLRLLVKNYRCFQGEIDLIMQDREDIVFVEVRSRSNSRYGSALESITPKKMAKLIKASTHYLQAKKCLYKVNSRFDVIAISPTPHGMQMEWIKNAFSVDYLSYR